MGVETRCGAYNANIADWKKVRHVIAGERAVRSEGTTYLPRPSGMEDPEWKCYLERAHFFNATGRAADGLHGGVFQKKPVLTDSTPDIDKILEDVDRAGRGIDQFANDCVWDALQTNWGGILVDYPQADDIVDRGTAEKLGLRSYAAWYSAESIINWRYTTKKNQRVLALVVLHEPYARQTDGDEFETEIKNRYRVLDFGPDGKYRVRVFNDAMTDGLTIPETDVTPKINGAALDFIPFFTLPGSEPEKSMLLDLANENIGHYQKTADYENGLHLTGIPTPYATGMSGPPMDKDGNPLPIKMGGTSFIFVTDPSGTVGYLEFEGAGLEQLEKALLNTEERMAILGARIISAEKKGIESAEAARIHRAGENSVLSAFALNASEVFTKVIRLLAEWEKYTGAETVSYQLNTDYNNEAIEANLFSAIVQARLSREMPKSVYFWNLKKAGKIPDEMSLEQWEEELALEDEGGDGPNGDDERVPPVVPGEKDDGKAAVK